MAFGDPVQPTGMAADLGASEISLGPSEVTSKSQAGQSLLQGKWKTRGGFPRNGA